MIGVRVCHVTSLHQYSDGRIFERYCKSLAKKYEVYLLAPNTETRVEGGIHIVGVTLPSVNQRIKRWLKINTILGPLFEINADIYHFHDPELMGLGLKLQKKGKIVIFDSHEDVPNLIKIKPYIPKPLRNLMAKVYCVYERRCLSRYDAVVSVTGYIVDRLKQINLHTYQITNYPKLQERQIEDRKWDRTLCFAGLLTPNWMLKEIISILPKIDATFYIAGNYSGEDYINSLKQVAGWENVVFMGRLSRDEVFNLYNNCSVGLAIETYDNPNAGYHKGSLGTTKIPEYMSMGLPIVVSNTEVWGGVVRKYNCGVAIDNPTNSNEIAKAIRYLLDNPEEAKRLGENGLIAVKEEFNWEAQERIVFNMYDEILNK